MPTLNNYTNDAVRKVLLAGSPKGSGKTTTAMTAPGNKLLLQYDIGSPTIPPGVDPATVFLRTYPSAVTDVKIDSDKWKRPKNVGAAVITDLVAVRDAVLSGTQAVLGSEMVPWILTPGDTIIMDGWVQYMQDILDWVLAVNGKANPEDFENRHAAWGKRLNQARIMMDMILPLPVNVVITTWVIPEKETRLIGNGKTLEVETGKILPDLGGKLNVWGPGKVDTSLYLYSEKQMGKGVRFLAQLKPDERFEWIGSRNDYSGRATIDLTIDEKDKSLPWNRLFCVKGGNPWT